jgi:agmatine deiminase
LGGQKVIWLNQGIAFDETDGHVDEIATFVAPGKVLCLVTSDQEDQNYLRYQENLAILKQATDAKGRRLEVFTVEQPPAVVCDGQRLTLSYVNFYLANKGVVMPAFGHPHYDRAAFDVLSKLYEGYTIVQVNALDIFKGGGGIHCITQQQPDVV